MPFRSDNRLIYKYTGHIPCYYGYYHRIEQKLKSVEHNGNPMRCCRLLTQRWSDVMGLRLALLITQNIEAAQSAYDEMI